MKKELKTSAYSCDQNHKVISWWLFPMIRRVRTSQKMVSIKDFNQDFKLQFEKSLKLSVESCYRYFDFDSPHNFGGIDSNIEKPLDTPGLFMDLVRCVTRAAYKIPANQHCPIRPFLADWHVLIGWWLLSSSDTFFNWFWTSYYHLTLKKWETSWEFLFSLLNTTARCDV